MWVVSNPERFKPECMEVLLLLFMIVVNGLFVMSEFALVTSKRSRLSKLAEDGEKSASVAMKLGQEPSGFLSTIQIGLTSIGILNGPPGAAIGWA